MSAWTDPREILRRWVEGVNGGKADSVADLYAADGVLLATFSPDALRTRPQIEGYFREFAGRVSARVVLDESSVIVQAAGGDCYALTGRYTFQIDGDTAAAHPARFTFIVDVSKERPILHHHSSQMPRGT